MPLQPAPTPSCFPPLPRSVAALGTRRPDGSANFMALAWQTPLSYEPPLVGVVVGREKASHRFLFECPDFTLSFLSLGAAGLVQALGTSSGARADKVNTLRLRLLAPQHGNAPMLADSWLAYECRVVARHATGDQTLFVGEILGAYYDPRHFESGELSKEARPLIQAGEASYASLGERCHPADAPDRSVDGGDEAAKG
ncbi:MAG: flavin reductase family protein [Acidobacteriota bacterium]